MDKKGNPSVDKKIDISSVLVVGAGPIVIGQACEFDYSGTQACKALREEGLRVILINSNPATIMTDPEVADATYMEPITPEVVEKIIEIEKPEALLSTVGGQTALNCSLELVRLGVLEKHNVQMIGATPEAIEKAENREMFNKAMSRIGLEVPRNTMVSSLEKAIEAVGFIGFPAVIRPSFTLGGQGGGIAKNMDELREIVSYGLEVSPTHQVLIDESVLGWKEYEMEVVRDRNDNAMIVCSIENIDPMGIHTGDSITVAPALTLTDKEFQIMRNAAIAVLREVGVESGGSNVQFAVNPRNGRLLVIEMNPRVSRSSALASKATGFPIAKVAAKLALGYTLDELSYSAVKKPPLPSSGGSFVGETSKGHRGHQGHQDHCSSQSYGGDRQGDYSHGNHQGHLGDQVTHLVPAAFEPAIDYVVTKIPRFNFEKFMDTTPLLSTSMRSVGEVMSLGRSFGESLQKGFDSLERSEIVGLGAPPIKELEGVTQSEERCSILRRILQQPVPDRLLITAEAMRQGFSLEEIQEITSIDMWFLQEIERIVRAEDQILRSGLPKDKSAWVQCKKMGFSDARLAQLTQVKEPHGTKTHGVETHLTEEDVRARRHQQGVSPVYKAVDTCAAEFESSVFCLYSTYEGNGFMEPECEAGPSGRRKVVILGSGPNRIGQGIEFDYTCVHAAQALSSIGYETIMVNCNPETVSTDYDSSDKLYFEPLSREHVLEILRREQQNGELVGVIVQLGGQTPLKRLRAFFKIREFPSFGLLRRVST